MAVPGQWRHHQRMTSFPSCCRRGAASCVLLMAASAALAQPAPAASAAAPIGYPTVAAALQDLTAQDGNGTVVVHTDGWTIINQPAAAAQWSFPPADHEAAPALVRRVIHRGPNRAVDVQTSTLCEGNAAACERLKAQFETMNDRITQSIKSRGAPVPPR